MLRTVSARLEIPRRLNFRAEGIHHLPRPSLELWMGEALPRCAKKGSNISPAISYTINYTWVPPMEAHRSQLPAVCPCASGM